MSEFRLPKCPESLKNKNFNTKTRSAIQLPEYLFLSDFDRWNIQSIVEDYFLFSEAPSSTGHALYSEAIEFLNTFIESRVCGNKSEKAFVRKFLTYLEQPHSKKLFLQQYRNLERSKRLDQSIVEMEEEVEITSNELVGENLRQKSQKRKLETEEDEPLRIQVKSKSYKIQAPSMVKPLNSPVIEEENFSKINERVDVCISSNLSYASEATLEEYQSMQNSHRKNENIKSFQLSMEFFNKFREMKKENALEGVTALNPSDSKFAQFVKFSLVDFMINTMRIDPIPTNDERTMYVEYVVPLFKYFSNITGLLSFSWCERKDKDAASSIFFVTQEKCPTTLLDGIGRNKSHTPCIVIESSGFNITANIDHTLEDSIKNIKSATDALKTIMCKFPNSSCSTFKKINVYSVQIIQNTMTLMRYSLKDKHTFRAIECCAVSVPTSFEAKLYMLAVYDMFAFLYNDLLKQAELFKTLELEQLGVVDVDEEEMVCRLSSH